MADRILFLETPDIPKTPVGEEPTAGSVTSVNGKTGAVTLSASDVGALPDNTPIPSAVTEQTVAGWGFTKNTGDYSKPSGGIPKTDLASDVRTSLGKADSALQEHQSLDAYRTASAQDSIDAAQDAAIAAKYTKPSGGIPASDLAAGVIPDISGKANTTDVYSKAEVDDMVLGRLYVGSVDEVDENGGPLSLTLCEEDLPDMSDVPNPYFSIYTIDGSDEQYAPKTALANKLDTTGNAYRSASIPMGHLDATSTATVMTATVDGITELRDGVCMWLRNGVITSASGFTLNVNGLGAKPCYSSLAAASRSTTIFNVNYTMLFVYNSTRVDGGCWDIVYGVDTNTTYTTPKLGFGYGTCTTAAATAAKTASISSYALTTGGIVSIKFENDVPAGATLNISSKGAKAIYHRGAAITDGVIKAGDTATFVYSTYYHLISIDRDEAGSGDAPIQTVKVNGTALVPDANKAVDIPVPTVADVIEETVMVVHLTPTSADLSGTMNRTGSEILAAYSAGMRIVAEVDGLNGSFEWNQAMNGSMVTQFLYGYGGNRELIQVVAGSGSSTAYYAHHIAQLPTVTATDNGKFLCVVNGAWAAESVSSYQGGSY
jgi:hypothetical protein